MKANEMYEKLNQDYDTIRHDWQGIQDTFSKRLASIGEAQHALAELKADDMYAKLYNDYTAIRHDWEQALNDLTSRLTTLDDTRRQLKELKNDVQLDELECIFAETHKEGTINGSNAEKRKAQTTLYLDELRKTNSPLKTMRLELARQQVRTDELEVEAEMLRQKISFLRNLARMIAGLAAALGG